MVTAGPLVAQTVKNLPAMWRPRFDPWVGKIPWKRGWQPTKAFLPGESHEQRSQKESEAAERLSRKLLDTFASTSNY